ncbi:MAG: hypothetical protein L0154_27345, partial [Chloroflexi bacterium]|nr:hypothetical protein [Chloroflexota bacterium]
MRNLSLIKTIIRHLRFIELPELKGQQITIQDMASIEATLRGNLTTLVTDNDPFLSNNKTELRLAKYDLIDAAFLVPADRFDWGQQNSMETLKSW